MSVVDYWFLLGGPPRSTRTNTLFPDARLFGSGIRGIAARMRPPDVRPADRPGGIAAAPARRLCPRAAVRSHHSDAGGCYPAGTPAVDRRPDRKSTRLNSRTNAHIVCRLLLENKKHIHRLPSQQIHRPTDH